LEGTAQRSSYSMSNTDSSSASLHGKQRQLDQQELAQGRNIPTLGQLRLEGSIPVKQELPICCEVPVEGTFPTRVNLIVEGNLRVVGSIPLQTCLQVESLLPVDGRVRCAGDAEFSGSLPVHGTIPIDAVLPLSATLPLPGETTSVQRFIRPVEAPPPKPKVQEPKPAREPVLQRVLEPLGPPPAVVLPAYIDPRPPVSRAHEVGEKAHDFEYHREGNYAARHNSFTKNTPMAPAGPNRYGGAPIAAGPIVGTDAPIVGSDYDRAFTHVPNAIGGIDPRPPLKVEHERVHDYEVHRESGYAKGHTVVGVRPAVGIHPVHAGPTGDAWTSTKQQIA